MTPSWTDYQGHVVNAWRLDSFLGLRGAAACYEGRDSDRSAALIQIVPTDERGAGQLARSWDAARDLAEPHLLRVHETGSTLIDDVVVYYAIFELPEDDVAELMARGGIAAHDARGIVAAAASALEYLHSRGLRHGAVYPSNIMFVADSPKLSVDTLAPADATGRDEDLQQLGTTITEMITGEKGREEASQLPSPLRELALGCSSGSAGGWTAGRVLEVASGRLPATTIDETAAPDKAAAKRPAPERAHSIRRPKAIRLRWPVIAVAAVALFALIFSLRRHFGASDEPVASTPQRTAPATPAIAPPTPAQPAPDRATPSRKDRSNSWAVIAATYTDFGAAEKRAHSLRRRLQAHVYPPHGSGNRYYVVLGSGLSSATAHKLRARAIRMGAPRDTYITILADR